MGHWQGRQSLTWAINSKGGSHTGRSHCGSIYKQPDYEGTAPPVSTANAFPHTSPLPHTFLQVFCLALSPALQRKGSEEEEGGGASSSSRCSERSALPASFPPLARSFHNSGHPQV